MQRILLIRHGETEINKDNPLRGLTEKGVRQIIETSFKIKPFLTGVIKIICSDTQRAQQTARIISKSLKINDIETHNLRILGDGSIRPLIEHFRNKKRPAKIYLSGIGDYEVQNIESPGELAKRWIQIFQSIKSDTIVVVGHEASLEAFLYNQKDFALVKKNFRKYFDYGDWAYLIDQELV